MMIPQSLFARRFLLPLAILVLTGASAQAQTYPNRPIKLVVGFTPGGGVDINGRLLAGKLSELLGQSVVVDNRPGAGTNIASEYVARSAPDGYTLLINTGALAINMSLYKNLGYDTLRDFAPVSVFSESANILVVHPSVAAQNAAELVALAKAKPGVLNYSSAGAGTTQHLAGELFKLRTGTDIVHIPYKGSAPSLTALIAGDVQLSYANVPAILQHVKSGRLRPVATTGSQRSTLMPEVPTMQESGINGVELAVWYGVVAPAATPRDIVARLAEAVQRAARDPEMKKKLLDQGAEPVGNTPEEFARVLREEIPRWAEVVKAAKMRTD